MDTQAPAPMWSDEAYEAYETGMRTEREHQMALARFVEQKHRDELAEAGQRIEALTAQLATAKQEKEEYARKIMGIGTPYLDGLSETELERYSQLSPPEMFQSMRRLEAQLAAVDKWEVVRTLSNEEHDEIFVNAEFLTIAHFGVGLATFGWPEDECEYAVMRRVADGGGKEDAR